MFLKKKSRIKDDTQLLRCCFDICSWGAERLLNLSWDAYNPKISASALQLGIRWFLFSFFFSFSFYPSETTSVYCDGLFLSEDKLSHRFPEVEKGMKTKRFLSSRQDVLSNQAFTAEVGHLRRGYLHLLLRIMLECHEGWLSVTPNERWRFGPIWCVSLGKKKSHC